MGRADYYLPGGWNMVCAVCGFKYKNVEMRLRWDNVWCCPQDYELRQPQDFVRGVKDQMAVPYSNPEPPVVFDSFPPIPTPTGDILVGDPTIYLNGNPLVENTDYTIVLPQGRVTFTVPPPLNSVIAWTGTWQFNSGAQQVFSTPFQFAQGNGSGAVFNVYWAFVPYPEF
jgi:hypothetical protein